MLFIASAALAAAVACADALETARWQAAIDAVAALGGGRERSREALETPVPDVSGGYPAVTMFRHILPAYGLWTDFVDNLKLQRVSFRLRNGDEDLRPAVKR